MARAIMCARIGMVTGQGLAVSFRQRFTNWLLRVFVLALLAGIPALQTTSRPRALSRALLVLGRVSSHQLAPQSISWRRAGFQRATRRYKAGRSRQLRGEHSHEANGKCRERCQTGCFSRGRCFRLHHRTELLRKWLQYSSLNGFSRRARGTQLHLAAISFDERK
jgi:hypothetical protein